MKFEYLQLVLCGMICFPLNAKQNQWQKLHLKNIIKKAKFEIPLVKMFHFIKIKSRIKDFLLIIIVLFILKAHFTSFVK